MIGSIFWDISDHSFSKVSMRINDRKSSSLSHIINNHILKQGRFSHPRLPYNIHMTTSIVWSDSKGDFCPAKIGGSDRSQNILLSLNNHWEVYWWFKSTRGYPANRRCFYIHRRKVYESSKFFTRQDKFVTSPLSSFFYFFYFLRVVRYFFQTERIVSKVCID